MCHLCTEDYLDVCLPNKNIPICVNANCKTYYVLDNFQYVPDIIEKFIQACVIGLENDQGDQVETSLQLENNLKALRLKRKVFIEDKFPASVAFVAIHFFPQKVKKLEKNLEIKTKHHFNNLKKKCMMNTCKGFLGDDFICTLCNTRFCKSCEMIYLQNHQCKEDDLESMNLIKSCIKCPKCQLPILKSEGCNSMRCTHCGENFDYASGKSGGGGNNHNAKIEIRESFVHKYSKELGDELHIQLVNLQTFEPKEYSHNQLLKFLKQKHQEPTIDEKNQEINRNIAVEWQRIQVRHEKRKQYFRMMGEIEKAIIDKTITIKMVSQMEVKIKRLTTFKKITK